jgi:probable HAF family extracellular repeat protein
MQSLGDLPGGIGPSVANGINDNGEVVGNTLTIPQRPFLWTSPGGMQFLGVGDDATIANDINAHGRVVGNTTVANQIRGFHWTRADGMQDLGDLLGGRAVTGIIADAVGINDGGQVVGTAQTAFGPRAFLWTNAEGMQDLGLPRGPLANASESNGLLEASFANGINNAGYVVGHSMAAIGGLSAFLWTSGNGMRNLNDMVDVSGAGWTLIEATAINNSGQIVGWGQNPSGVTHAFMLTPIPEPSAWALATMALTSLNFLYQGL